MYKRREVDLKRERIPKEFLRDFDFRKDSERQPSATIYFQENQVWLAREYPTGILGVFPYLKEAFSKSHGITFARLIETIEEDPDRKMHWTARNLLDDSGNEPFLQRALIPYVEDEIISAIPAGSPIIGETHLQAGRNYETARIRLSLESIASYRIRQRKWKVY